MHTPSPTEKDPNRRRGDDACAGRVEDLAVRLIEGDAQGAEAIVEQLFAGGVDPDIVLARLIQPAMTWIGEQWECGNVDVADEHLATTIAHQVLAIIYERLLVAPLDSRGRVLLASAEADHHALGLRMAADVLEGAGYQVVHLGADVPTEALLAAVARHRPSVVGLSVTLTSALPAVDRVIADLAEHYPDVHVIVGGRAANHVHGDAATLHVLSDVTQVRRTVDAIASAATQGPGGARATLPLSREKPGDDEVARAALFEDAMFHAAELTRRHARRARQFQMVSLQDELTGLWNRRAFDDRVLELIGDASKLPLAMLMLDIDGFKAVNDVHGHQIGDAALKQVARSIQNELRAGDFAARLGGDEFVVLLPGTPRDQAAGIAERIRAAIAQNAEPPYTVSIGVEECGDDVRASVLGADTSLYRAKGSGRNTVCA